MRPHGKEVHDLFGLLGYIVKATDPDGIELHFTMSRDRKARARKTGQLLQILETVQYFGTSNIRIQLEDILQAYHTKLRDHKPTRSLFNWTRSPRPVRRQNVYILTDGVWQPGCDPTLMIKKLVDNLEQNSMEREQFGIQFIRFGNDPDGIDRLNQLDSGLGLSMYAPFSPQHSRHGANDSPGTSSIRSLRTGTSGRCFSAQSTTGLTTMMSTLTAVSWLPLLSIGIQGQTLHTTSKGDLHTCSAFSVDHSTLCFAIWSWSRNSRFSNLSGTSSHRARPSKPQHQKRRVRTL